MQAVWEWSSEQIVRLSQAQWENWTPWKQVLLVIVAAAVVYALYSAARQLWWAAMNVLWAVATFVGTLIVTLPTILLAGAIALGGLWVINNFDSLSSLRSIMRFPASDAGHRNGKPPASEPPGSDAGHRSGKPPASEPPGRADPPETTGGAGKPGNSD
jgi:hypothetical protein